MQKIFLLWFLFLFSLTKTAGQYTDSLKQQLVFAKEDTNHVNILNNLGRFYMFSYPDTAASYAMISLQLSQKINYKLGEARSLGILCLSSTYLGNYTSALGFGLKALPIFEDLQDTTMLAWTNIQDSKLLHLS